MMNRVRILACLTALSATAGAAGTAAAAGTRTISVEGIGIVTSVPDEAQFSFGVSTTAKTARGALSGNAARMNRLIAAIKAQGIAAADIQTSEISLDPNENDNETKIIDFTANNTVTVITKQITKAGSIVDAAVEAGANVVGGPSLTRSDQATLTKQALKAAVADARVRALTIATAAGVKLGAVLSVTESSGSPVTESSAAAKESAASPTPVEPGTTQTEQDVSVTFSIR